MKRVIIKLSRWGHLIVNRLAWRFVPNPNQTGRNKHWLWRLNDWVARPSVDDYVYRRTGKTRADWEKETKK